MKGMSFRGILSYACDITCYYKQKKLKKRIALNFKHYPINTD
jgi:hypothetical protein